MQHHIEFAIGQFQAAIVNLKRLDEEYAELKRELYAKKHLEKRMVEFIDLHGWRAQFENWLEAIEREERGETVRGDEMPP